MGKPIGSAGAILSLLLIMAGCNAVNTSGAVRTIDHKVPHVSTVPANKGEQVEIFLREKVMASGGAQPQPVVLRGHGGVSPSTLAFDVEHETYSWMEYLARAGFDVFAMDMTGYGKSAHPKMDDPCNVGPALQKTLIPKTLDEVCKPPYPFQLVNRQSEHDELDRVIEYIRNLRGVDRLTSSAGQAADTAPALTQASGRRKWRSWWFMRPPTIRARIRALRRPRYRRLVFRSLFKAASSQRNEGGFRLPSVLTKLSPVCPIVFGS